MTYLDSEWALNPIVRRDVVVSELLASIGGNAFPDRRELLVELLDIDENWHMHAISDGMAISIYVRKRITGASIFMDAESDLYRGTSPSAIGNGINETLDGSITR